MNIFIYRPDLGKARNIDPSLCFTPQGQSYHDWRRDREELYQYKLELAKRKIEENKRKNRYEIYIMRVNGDWGAVMPCKRHNLIFNADKGVELTEFVTNLKEDFEKWG